MVSWVSRRVQPLMVLTPQQVQIYPPKPHHLSSHVHPSHTYAISHLSPRSGLVYVEHCYRQLTPIDG